MGNIPLLTDVLEPYMRTPEGLQLWKTKGLALTCKNLLENVFILTSNIAEYFEIRHNNLLSRNFLKLQQEGYLPDHLLNIEQMVDIGSLAKAFQTIYALTRHQAEILVADLSGPKARAKKFQFLLRLHSIESDVLQGLFDQALQKASSWDGVQLLEDLGFTGSLPNQMATTHDIATFLDVPIGSLSSFLSHHKEISPTKLTKDQIREAGRKASHLNAYTQDDVFKIAFWMNSEVGSQLKKKIFGSIGAYGSPAIKEELGWKVILSRIFEGLGFRYQYPIGEYIVDFFVEKLGLVLECDKNDHRYYDKDKETQRDRFITQYYALIRFNSEIDLESLVNGILLVRPNELLKLYLGQPAKRKKMPHGPNSLD